MTRARITGIAVLAAVALAGCGSATVGAPSATAEAANSATAAAFSAWLHLTAPAPDGTLELLGSDGHVVRSLPGGELTNDGSRLLTTAVTAAATHLRVLDTRSGAVLDDRSLPAGFHLPVLGPARHPVALAPGERFAALEDTPGGAQAGTVTTTRIAVVALASGGATRLITLQGDFDVDALSSDGTRLYLIESLAPAADGTITYRVRSVDVSSGTLDPRVVIDKSDGEAAMAGVPLSRAIGSDPGWVLTIYGFGPRGPFVHGLGVDTDIAVCLDLPADTHVNNQEQQLLWSLARDRSGQHMLAVNGGTGQVVELGVSGGPPNLGRAAQLPLSGTAPQAGLLISAEAKRLVSTGAVMSPDGSTLYAVADQGIVAVDTATLTTTRTLARDLKPSGLAISPDGAALMVVEEDGATVDLVDARSGAVTALVHGSTGMVDAILGAG